MESRPLNPEFRNNPENFHPCRVNLDMTFPEGAVKSGFTLYFFQALLFNPYTAKNIFLKILSAYYLHSIYSLQNTLSTGANTMNPDQTAPAGAVWSGFILIALLVMKFIKHKSEQTTTVAYPILFFCLLLTCMSAAYIQVHFRLDFILWKQRIWSLIRLFARDQSDLSDLGQYCWQNRIHKNISRWKSRQLKLWLMKKG